MKTIERKKIGLGGDDDRDDDRDFGEDEEPKRGKRYSDEDIEDMFPRTDEEENFYRDAALGISPFRSAWE